MSFLDTYNTINKLKQKAKQAKSKRKKASKVYKKEMEACHEKHKDVFIDYKKAKKEHKKIRRKIRNLEISFAEDLAIAENKGISAARLRKVLEELEKFKETKEKSKRLTRLEKKLEKRLSNDIGAESLIVGSKKDSSKSKKKKSKKKKKSNDSDKKESENLESVDSVIIANRKKLESKKATDSADTTNKTAPTKASVKKEKTTTTEIKTSPVSAKTVKSTTRKGVSSQKTKSSTSTQKDNLRRIEGIGPKIAEILTSKGIATFAALSTTPITQLQSILEEAGPRFRMHIPNTWPKQAALAAESKWTELKEYQDRLDGGKEIKS